MDPSAARRKTAELHGIVDGTATSLSRRYGAGA
jgi:hypothetical protein